MAQLTFETIEQKNISEKAISDIAQYAKEIHDFINVSNMALRHSNVKMLLNAYKLLGYSDDIFSEYSLKHFLELKHDVKDTQMQKSCDAYYTFLVAAWESPVSSDKISLDTLANTRFELLTVCLNVLKDKTLMWTSKNISNQVKETFLTLLSKFQEVINSFKTNNK